MKRAVLALALLLCVGLTACSGGEKTEEPFSTDLSATLLESGAFSEELESLDCDTAWALYRLEDAGLEREQLTDGQVYYSSGATCEELSILLFADADAAQTARDALQSYLEGQIQENRDYRPGEIPKLEEALLLQRENTLLLAVCADYAPIQKALS